MNHQLDVNILSNPNSYTDYSDIMTGVLALGTTVSMGGYDWIVCHVDTDGKVAFLIDAVIECNTVFGQASYNGSTLAAVAKSFEDALPTNITDRLLNVTTSGVVAKVFVPTRSQFTGSSTSTVGFDWFSSSDNRIGYLNGVESVYWTSTFFGNTNQMYVVDTKGSLSSGVSYMYTEEFGFRPCICMPL